MQGKRKYNSLGIVAILMLSFVINANIISASAIANYHGINISNEEYQTLLELGFSENEIYYMDYETYMSNKDADAHLISQDTKYFKILYTDFGIGRTYEISEDEMNSRHDYFDRGYLYAGYRTEVTTISENGNYYRYHISTGWNSIPTTKSYDIIGIGFNDDVYVVDSTVWFNYTYSLSDFSSHYSTTFFNKVANANGGSAVYKLPDEFVGLTANLYYDVANNSSDPIDELTMCGDYAHAIYNVTVAQARDYYCGSGGIDLYSGSYPYYDQTPCVYAYAYPPSDW